MISQDALNIVTTSTWNDQQQHIPDKLCQKPPNELYPMPSTDIQQFAAGVTHPITGEVITDYCKLMKDPTTREVWTQAFRKEIRGLAQGDDKTDKPGSDTIFFLTHKEIANIPKDLTVTCAQIVVDYCPQKAVPNCVHITAGVETSLTTPVNWLLAQPTSHITTAKIMRNVVISPLGTWYACFDLKTFYLGAPLDHYKYVHIPIALTSNHIIQQ